MCIFSLKLPTDSCDTIPLKVEAELMYTNLELDNKKNKIKLRILAKKPNFECVERKVYLITNALNSVHQYIPLGFDPNYFCMFEGSIHVMFSGYDAENPDDIQEFLFEDKKLIGASEVDRAYYKMCDPLRTAFDSIKNSFCTYQEKLFFANNEAKSLAPKSISLPLFCQDSDPKEMSLYDVTGSHDPKTISEYISQDIKSLSELVKESFKKLIQLISYNPEQVCRYLKQVFDLQVNKHFIEYMIIETKSLLHPPLYRENLPEYVKKAGDIRLAPYFSNLESLPIQADDLYNQIPNHPIFFVEKFNSSKSESLLIDLEIAKLESNVSKILDLHLIILMHGYRGSSKDVHLIKGYINQIYPQCHVICAKSNEYSSDCILSIQGQNLAEEVIQYVIENKIPLHRFKLTFMAHSMGGLVIRAALPYLSRYKANMFGYITLSSPHLGVKYADSYLLELGKWFIKKFDKSESFEQMTLNDGKSIKETYIYEMSRFEGLSWFTHLVFFSCCDDPYVPEDSARLEIPRQSAPDKESEEAYSEMIKNIWGKIEVDKVTRVDVHFKNRDLFNSCVCCGNTHIDFLDNACFIKMMCYGFPKLFA